VVVSGVAFSGAADAALTTVHKFHQANPLVQGIGREELKARVAGNGSSLLFQAILDKLASDKKIVLAQEVIYEYGRAVTLNADEERMRVQLAERFRSLGLQIASMDETIDALKLNRQTARKIVQLMLKEKTLMKITEELLIDRTVLDQLIADVRALKSTSPKLGVGEFKNLTGVSRKHAIPLLEYLDRQRVTRRVGDERMIL
jgi:selenocysteine-specific elongation factor